jgi:hypothetical protein
MDYPRATTPSLGNPSTSMTIARTPLSGDHLDRSTFKGCEYVQLARRVNDTNFDPIVGLHKFVEQSERAIDHEVAAKIVAAARRLVNSGANFRDRFKLSCLIGAKLLTPGT